MFAMFYNNAGETAIINIKLQAPLHGYSKVGIAKVLFNAKD